MVSTPWHYARPGALWATLEADLEVYKIQAPIGVEGMRAEVKLDPLTKGHFWRWLLPEPLWQALQYAYVEA